MTEKILTTKKTGMAMLLLTILLYVVAIAVLVVSVNFGMLIPWSWPSSCWPWAGSSCPA